MFVVHWPGQTMLGPFDSIESAVKWCDAAFGLRWGNIVKIYAVEAPPKMGKKVTYQERG